MQDLNFNSRPCKMLTLRDMTSHYKFDKIQKQRDLLDGLNQTVSHELMTPLACIVEQSKQVAKNAKNKTTKRLATSIARSAQLMRLNVRDLLDANAIERGAFTLNPGNADLKVLMKETIETLRPIWNPRRVKV